MTTQISAVSIGFPPSIGIELQATSGANQTDDQEPYMKSPFLITENGLLMKVGFSVGWAANGDCGLDTFHYYAGWLDVIEIAESYMSNPAPDQLDQYDEAYVRVGYSATGTGGIVWTSGKWLR